MARTIENDAEGRPAGFTFYVSDWKGDDRLALISLAARGAYIELLAAQWKLGGPVPWDPSKVSLLARCSVEEAVHIMAELDPFFDEVEGGRENPKLREEYAKSMSRRARGRAGGRAKATKVGTKRPTKTGTKTPTDRDRDRDRTQNRTPDQRESRARAREEVPIEATAEERASELAAAFEGVCISAAVEVSASERRLIESAFSHVLENGGKLSKAKLGRLAAYTHERGNAWLVKSLELTIDRGTSKLLDADDPDPRSGRMGRGSAALSDQELSRQLEGLK